jgi:predicted metal-dependent phosphoesterase TrpH
MSMEGRFQELAEAAVRAAVEKVWRVLQAHHLETDERLGELMERVAALEAAQQQARPTVRAKRDPA